MKGYFALVWRNLEKKSQAALERLRKFLPPFGHDINMHRAAPDHVGQMVRIQAEVDPIAADSAAGIAGERITVAVYIQLATEWDHARVYRDHAKAGSNAGGAYPSTAALIRRIPCGDHVDFACSGVSS
jgi:hypothetical protein